MKTVYLASKSPRRRQILLQIGIAHQLLDVDVDETMAEGNPDAALAELARRKAAAGAAQVADGLVIGADTVVVLDGRMLGKPRDAQDAHAMLGALSGRVHQVKTGVCVVDALTGRHVQAVETTQVSFLKISDAAIQAYVQTGEPMDKAGAYGVQGLGARFVKSIHGCYYNAVGLPVTLLCALMDEIGCE